MPKSGSWRTVWLCAHMYFATAGDDRPSGMYQRRRSVLRQVGATTGASWKLSYCSGAGKHASNVAATPGDLDPRFRRTRGSGDTGRMRRVAKQMSGSQQKCYQGQCWNCGKPGAYAGGWRMTCAGCEVNWMGWSSAPRGDPNHVCWMGKIIDCVDFTRPEALGAPA